VSGSNIFAAADGGVFLSTNNGTSWTALTNRIVNTLAASGNIIFSGTYSNGIYRSTDNGTTWSNTSTGLGGNNVVCFAISGNNIFSGTNHGVFLSTNNGSNWVEVDSGITNLRDPLGQFTYDSALAH
jgi:photosystem II stability/assembly factor-like uncharacterized protein